MQIYRVGQGNGVDYVKDRIVLEDGIDREVFCENLKTAIEQYGNDVCFLLAFDTVEVEIEEDGKKETKRSEEPEPVAFILAICESPIYVWIQQAWSSKGLDSSIQDMLFFRVLQWAESVGRSEVRMSTKRKPKAFQRRWGFAEHSIVMKFDIPENLESRLLENAHSLITGKSEEGSPSSTEPSNERTGHGNSLDADKTAERNIETS